MTTQVPMVILIWYTPRWGAKYFWGYVLRSEREKAKEYGAGLGLSIVKQVVEIYQGKIHAESKEKEGTSFFISLPRAEN